MVTFHRFEVDVNGWKVVLEPDEERNYRALIEELIKEIVRVIKDSAL